MKSAAVFVAGLATASAFAPAKQAAKTTSLNAVSSPAPYFCHTVDGTDSVTLSTSPGDSMWTMTG